MLIERAGNKRDQVVGWDDQDVPMRAALLPGHAAMSFHPWVRGKGAGQQPPVLVAKADAST